MKQHKRLQSFTKSNLEDRETFRQCSKSAFVLMIWKLTEHKTGGRWMCLAQITNGQCDQNRDAEMTWRRTLLLQNIFKDIYIPIPKHGGILSKDWNFWNSCSFGKDFLKFTSFLMEVCTHHLKSLDWDFCLSSQVSQQCNTARAAIWEQEVRSLCTCR